MVGFFVFGGGMARWTCDECNGAGSRNVTGFFDYSDGSGEYTSKNLECSYCYGTGKVTDEQMQARRIGRYLRERRHEMDLTLREQAKILGRPLSQLNAIEQGRIL